ncbi:hypothetical protein [Mucilaginibacter antarcticus]|uniref:Uncharacterized protein n=1 Tax=Mucilaginibacter antarcticus TaxID=1855725 RepID=A0ABW5XP27_9SPHI
MKKYLLIVLFYLYCNQLQAQSISLLNLINLANLNNTQIGSTLTSNKVWAMQYGEELDGFVVEHYQTTAQPVKKETIIGGVGFKTATGSVLHTVSYVSPNVQYVINLVAETKKAGLNMFFQGSDARDNIYIYESFLYHVVIRLAINNSKGVIDITQKHALVQ